MTLCDPLCVLKNTIMQKACLFLYEANYMYYDFKDFMFLCKTVPILNIYVKARAFYCNIYN
jgi:hypothetical protein